MVGNAVPFPLGFAIGKANAAALAAEAVRDADELARSGGRRTTNFFAELKLKLFGDAIRAAHGRMTGAALGNVDEDVAGADERDGGWEGERASPPLEAVDLADERVDRVVLNEGGVVNGRGRKFVSRWERGQRVQVRAQVETLDLIDSDSEDDY